MTGPGSLPCPATDELRQLLQRTLEPTRRELLDDHVEECGFCQSRMDALAQDEWQLPPTLLLPAQPPRQPDDDEADFIRHLVRSIPVPSEPCDSPADPVPPTVLPCIPGFDRLELVGRGGSGEVYRAWQPGLGRWVALKTLVPNRSPDRAARVNREARLLGRLTHPHIVRIHGMGEVEGQPYLVMEWIAGGSLQDRIRRGPLPINDAVRFAREIASALELVHAAGIIHRDLKPANVLLDPSISGETDGDGPLIARLTDFSIAFEPDANERLSQTGMVIGTPDYMAPEQTGLAPQPAAVGPAADIYGVGAVLYAALTGRPPHQAETPVAVLNLVATREPDSPCMYRPEIPRDLGTIVGKCLRQDPAQRYQSAGELARDLERFLQGRPIHARPYTLGERIWNWGQRRPIATTVGACLLGSGLYVAATLLEQGRQREQLVSQLVEQTDEAEKATAIAEKSLAEARYSRWQTIRQLILKAETQLQDGSLVAGQRRGLVETVRRHLRNRLDDADSITTGFAPEFAEMLNHWAELEERHGFFPQALEDGSRLDAVLPKLEDGSRRQSLTLSRNCRHVRLLDRLNRLDDASQQLAALLEPGEAAVADVEVLAVLDAASQHARVLRDAGRKEQALALVRRARGEWWLTGEQSTDNLLRSQAQLELQLLELDLATPLVPGTPPSADEEDWTKTLRRVFDRQRNSVLALTLEPVRAAQRLDELARHRPQLAQFTRDNWRQEIHRLDPVTHAAERLIQQLSFDSAATTDVRPALEPVRQFIDQHPDDLATRQRLAGLLVRMAQSSATPETTASLEQARLAIDLVMTAHEPWRTSAEGRSVLAEAYRAEASALRSQGGLPAARQSLELALSHSPDEQRGNLFLELVQLHLALGDRAQAELIAARIEDESPAREAVRRLLRESSSHETSSP